MSGGAALAATSARDGAAWRKRLRVPDHETIRGADTRSTSNRVSGIEPFWAGPSNRSTRHDASAAVRPAQAAATPAARGPGRDRARARGTASWPRGGLGTRG